MNASGGLTPCSLTPSDLRGLLIAAISSPDNVSGAEKGWHPRPDNQVLDLVYPSLYLITPNRTFVKDLRLVNMRCYHRQIVTTIPSRGNSSGSPQTLPSWRTVSPTCVDDSSSLRIRSF